MNKPNPFLDWLTIQPMSKIMEWRKLGSWVSFALMILAFVLLALLIGTLVQIGRVLVTGDLGDNPLRGLSFLFAFLLGAPFVIWRSVVAQNQADTQRASLVNDKINAATEGLHAMRQVTRPAENGTLETRWEDDIIRRSAAIDQLEGLAQEEPAEARRIARMLCTYVKELSREYRAEPTPDWLADVDWADRGAAETAMKRLNEWTETLTVKRTDMQRAMESLSVLNSQILEAEYGPDLTRYPSDLENTDWTATDKLSGHLAKLLTWRDTFTWANAPKPVIDVEGANLQSMRLIGLDLRFAVFKGADMQGAVLRGAEMQGAELRDAEMQGAVLKDAEMQGAVLRDAKMQGAVLRDAEMQGAVLRGAEMQGAELSDAKMQGAVLRDAKMQGAVLRGAKMQGAVLKFAKMQGAVLRFAKMQGAALRDAMMQGAVLMDAKMQGADLRFAKMQGAALRDAKMQGAVLGFAEMQGADLRDAKMQGAVLGFAEMQGAVLRGAEMQGADLWHAEIDQVTNFIAANPSAAAMKFVDVVKDTFDQDQITIMFGDGTVTLPETLTRPAHWPPVDLSHDTFAIEWAAWRDDPAAYDWDARKDRYTEGKDYT